MHHDGTFNAHDRINSVIGMFEEFVKEYKVIVEENVMLKSQVNQTQVGCSEAEEEALEEKMKGMGVGEAKDEVKGRKEYLGYGLIEKEVCICED